MNNVIKRVWNQNKMVAIEDLKGMTFQAESGGHTFQISGVDDAGNVIALSGSVAGVFLRPDNTDVAITGSASGGVISVTLPANCYDVPGRFGLTIFITSGSSKTAIYAAVGTVTRTSSGTVAPGTSQSVVDLINAINAAVNSIPASYSALLADIAPTYSNSALYSVGQYAWYDGDLKRCIVPITTAESYTAAHWTSAVLGQDVSDLKSALSAESAIAGNNYAKVGLINGYYSSSTGSIQPLSTIVGTEKFHVTPGTEITPITTLTGYVSYLLWKYDGTFITYKDATSIIVPQDAYICAMNILTNNNVTSVELSVTTPNRKAVSDMDSALRSLIYEEYQLSTNTTYWSTGTGNPSAPGSSDLRGTEKLLVYKDSIISCNIKAGYILYWTEAGSFSGYTEINSATGTIIASQTGFIAFDFHTNDYDSVKVHIFTEESLNASRMDTLALFGEGKSIYDISTYNTGYITSNGTQTGDSYCYTKPIYLKAGDYLFGSSGTVFGANTGKYVRKTNEAGTASYGAVTVDELGTAIYCPYWDNRIIIHFTLSEPTWVMLNIGYITHTTKTMPQISNFMLCRGTTLADYGAYEAYHAEKYMLKTDNPLTEKMLSQITGLSNLYRKQTVFDGDSICHGTSVGDTSALTYGYGWAGRIGIANEMVWKNYGINGGFITSASNPSVGSHHSVVDNIDTMHTEFPNADYVIIEGGTNDADTLGTAGLGTFDPDDFSGTYDKTTFSGALETIFFKATSYWKGKGIGYIVAQKMGTSDTALARRRNYFERAIDICEKWGIPYIDLWTICYMNPNNPNCYNPEMSIDQNISNGYLYTDGQHLTAKGYDYISPIIENWMKSIR